MEQLFYYGLQENAINKSESELFRFSKKNIFLYGVTTFDDMRASLTQASTTFQANNKVTTSMRRKMVDWMVEVLCTYECCYSTFFTAVRLLDLFISASPFSIVDKDVHIIGVACMFIASKHEDLRSIELRDLVDNISHGNFSISQLRHMEVVIISTVGFEALSSAKVIDFINTFLFDFLVNNESDLRSFKLEKDIKTLMESSYFFALLAKHYEVFTCVDDYAMAIACLVCGLDSYRQKRNNQLSTSFLIQFVDFVVSRCGVEDSLIDKLRLSIKEAHKEYMKDQDIEKNLVKNKFVFNSTEMLIFKCI